MIMPFLPAICLNPKCAAIFPSGVFFEYGFANTFAGCTAGPCPNCQSDGRIPDGEYSVLGDRIFALFSDVADATILADYVSFIDQQLHSGTSPEDIRLSVNDKYPQFKSLSDLFPKSRSDAYAFLTILLTLIGLALDCSDKLRTKTPTVEIKQEIINNTFQRFYISSDSVSRLLRPSAGLGTRDKGH
jgi:hypothetical protein